jgi:hypothetical protein
MKKEYKNLVLRCQNCKKDFIIEQEDFNFYEKIKVPHPTWCPECRMIRRMAFRDYRVLYKRKSDKTGKIIFSIFDSKSNFKIWERDIWWSDKMEGLEYAKDINLNIIFLDQLKDLIYEVPLPSNAGWGMVNSYYSAGSGNLKNCYLVFVSTSNEDCMYSAEIYNTKNSIDVTRIESSELCYDSFNLIKCYQTFFSVDSESCVDVWFSKNLIGCSSCFGCTNLRNKKYCIFNKEYSKEEYFKLFSKFNLGSNKSILEIKEKISNFWIKSIRKFMQGHRNVNVSGEYINNSKNVISSYHVLQVENSKYIQLFLTPSAKDCYDCTLWGENTEMCYECSSVGSDCYNIKFSCRCYKGSRDCEYCFYCVGCSNCFGCSGLKYKQYCILNKQYTKEEYEELVEKIKKHMDEKPYIDSLKRIFKYGEFFPSELSPFAYNETIAQEYFPLTKEEALKQGYKWKDREERNYNIDIKNEDIPDDINDVNEDIIGKVIECQNNSDASKEGRSSDQDASGCTEAFKIIEPEYQFYKRMNLPLPRYCPNCRHHERLKQRNPLKLWHRTCMKEGCSNEFETSYAPERPEIVYCEECYKREVY